MVRLRCVWRGLELLFGVRSGLLEVSDVFGEKLMYTLLRSAFLS